MKVRLVSRISELRRELRLLRRATGLVPTMGALHAGHGRLIEMAREECDVVTVSIFVNPIQFNQASDFEGYPRTLEADLDFCERRAVDFVFAPDEREMYPEPGDTSVEVRRLTDQLCGAHRPGHFAGVATVVTKLLNIVQPDRAYFGEKDAQQLAVIRRLVRDLDIPVEIVPVPTVREPDGLAMSSRNKHLTPELRRKAPVIHRALEAAAARAREGERDAASVLEAARAVLREVPEIEVEYLEVVDASDMQPLKTIDQPALIAIAAWAAQTRLIDNQEIRETSPISLIPDPSEKW
jgi:pantoate--beta-alanine ligase